MRCAPGQRLQEQAQQELLPWVGAGAASASPGLAAGPAQEQKVWGEKQQTCKFLLGSGRSS